MKTACVCALMHEAVQELRTVCTPKKQSASGIKFMQWSSIFDSLALLDFLVVHSQHSLKLNILSYIQLVQVFQDLFFGYPLADKKA